MPLTVGEVFAGYTILRVLGAGAMGHFDRRPGLGGATGVFGGTSASPDRPMTPRV
jgi:hypothetical protein